MQDSVDRDSLLASLEQGLVSPAQSSSSTSQSAIQDLMSLLDEERSKEEQDNDGTLLSSPSLVEEDLPSRKKAVSVRHRMPKGQGISPSQAVRRSKACSIGPSSSPSSRRRPTADNAFQMQVNSARNPRERTFSVDQSDDADGDGLAGLMTGRPEDKFAEEDLVPNSGQDMNFDSHQQFMTIKRKTKRGTTFQVDHYQLGDKLGRGAFGIVYKGLDISTGQFVAVKRMQRSGDVDLESIRTEISLLSKFSHKNIVKYKEVVTSTNHINLVLEYVDSGSLANVLAGYGFFPEPLAALYIEQVLCGLSYLHKNNIIHRDIKGANLLITKEGVIKLADFGIATSVRQEVNRTSLVEGSPYWMAPEVIEMGEPNVLSDIWSLGCTLIELLTGVPPYFEMVAVSACYKMVKEDRPPFPEEISPALKDFLTQCFRRDPKDRPSASSLMAHEWITSRGGTSKPGSRVSYVAPVDLDSAKRTIRKYATLRDNGSNIRQSLSSVSFDSPRNDSDDESADSSIAASESPLTQSRTSDDVETTDGKKEKRKSKKEKKREKKDKKEKKSKKVKKGKKKESSTPPKLIWELKVEALRTETRRPFFAYTVYIFRISTDSQVWVIEKTWSDFKEMTDKLSTLLHKFNIADTLPPCPARKFFGQMEPKFVQKRKIELLTYMNELLATESVAKEGAPGHDILKQFLQVPPSS